MGTFLPFAKKANLYLFCLYTAITAIIIMLVNFGKVTYGADIQNSLMPITFVVIWLFVCLIRWITTKTKGTMQIFFLILSSAFMIFMSGYCFLEDSFRVH